MDKRQRFISDSIACLLQIENKEWCTYLSFDCRCEESIEKKRNCNKCLTDSYIKMNNNLSIAIAEDLSQAVGRRGNIFKLPKINSE